MCIFERVRRDRLPSERGRAGENPNADRRGMETENVGMEVGRRGGSPPIKTAPDSFCLEFLNWMHVCSRLKLTLNVCLFVHVCVCAYMHKQGWIMEEDS